MVERGSFHTERRSAERFAVSLPVRTDEGPGMTRDVSTSGLCLVMERLVEVGDEMEFVIDIPDPDTLADPAHVELFVRGKVVWIDSGSGVVGVKILPGDGSRQLAWSL